MTRSFSCENNKTYNKYLTTNKSLCETQLLWCLGFTLTMLGWNTRKRSPTRMAPPSGALPAILISGVEEAAINTKSPTPPLLGRRNYGRKNQRQRYMLPPEVTLDSETPHDSLPQYPHAPHPPIRSQLVRQRSINDTTPAPRDAFRSWRPTPTLNYCSHGE
jgi:hypothetical protein